MTVDTVPTPTGKIWDVLRGPILPATLDDGAAAFVTRHQLHLHQSDPNTLTLTCSEGHARVTARWRRHTPASTTANPSWRPPPMPWPPSRLATWMPPASGTTSSNGAELPQWAT